MPPEIAPQPLISVIIPTFNGARFLADSIACVRAQNYEPLEIIVVDDGSTDDTQNLMGRWPDVRYLRQTNQGPGGARNTGIQAASSDLLAFLDVDDLWTADHLQVLLPYLLADAELRFVWGASHFVTLMEDAAGQRTHVMRRESVPVFLVGAGLYRRSVFTEVGPFDPSLRIGEDTDWLAAARHKQVAQKQLADTVLIYREREGSLTSGTKSFRSLNTMAVLTRSIRRHRASQATEAAGG